MLSKKIIHKITALDFSLFIIGLSSGILELIGNAKLQTMLVSQTTILFFVVAILH